MAAAADGQGPVSGTIASDSDSGSVCASPTQPQPPRRSLLDRLFRSFSSSVTSGSVSDAGDAGLPPPSPSPSAPPAESTDTRKRHKRKSRWTPRLSAASSRAASPTRNGHVSPPPSTSPVSTTVSPTAPVIAAGPLAIPPRKSSRPPSLCDSDGDCATNTISAATASDVASALTAALTSSHHSLAANAIQPLDSHTDNTIQEPLLELSFDGATDLSTELTECALFADAAVGTNDLDNQHASDEEDSNFDVSRSILPDDILGHPSLASKVGKRDTACAVAISTVNGVPVNFAAVRTRLSMIDLGSNLASHARGIILGMVNNAMDVAHASKHMLHNNPQHLRPRSVDAADLTAIISPNTDANYMRFLASGMAKSPSTASSTVSSAPNSPRLSIRSTSSTSSVREGMSYAAAVVSGHSSSSSSSSSQSLTDAHTVASERLTPRRKAKKSRERSRSRSSSRSRPRSAQGSKYYDTRPVLASSRTQAVEITDDEKSPVKPMTSTPFTLADAERELIDLGLPPTPIAMQPTEPDLITFSPIGFEEPDLIMFSPPEASDGDERDNDTIVATRGRRSKDDMKQPRGSLEMDLRSLMEELGLDSTLDSTVLPDDSSSVSSNTIALLLSPTPSSAPFPSSSATLTATSSMTAHDASTPSSPRPLPKARVAKSISNEPHFAPLSQPHRAQQRVVTETLTPTSTPSASPVNAEFNDARLGPAVAFSPENLAETVEEKTSTSPEAPNVPSTPVVLPPTPPNIIVDEETVPISEDSNNIVDDERPTTPVDQHLAVSARSNLFDTSDPAPVQSPSELMWVPAWLHPELNPDEFSKWLAVHKPPSPHAPDGDTATENVANEAYFSFQPELRRSRSFSGANVKRSKSFTERTISITANDEDLLAEPTATNERTRPNPSPSPPASEKTQLDRVSTITGTSNVSSRRLRRQNGLYRRRGTTSIRSSFSPSSPTTPSSSEFLDDYSSVLDDAALSAPDTSLEAVDDFTGHASSSEVRSSLGRRVRSMSDSPASSFGMTDHSPLPMSELDAPVTTEAEETAGTEPSSADSKSDTRRRSRSLDACVAVAAAGKSAYGLAVDPDLLVKAKTPILPASVPTVVSEAMELKHRSGDGTALENVLENATEELNNASESASVELAAGVEDTKLTKGGKASKKNKKKGKRGKNKKESGDDLYSEQQAKGSDVKKEDKKDEKKEEKKSSWTSWFKSSSANVTGSSTSASKSKKKQRKSDGSVSPGLSSSSSTASVLQQQQTYTRYPIHVERAMYRLSHQKLSNIRRPLSQQVSISNLMLGYLELVAGSGELGDLSAVDVMSVVENVRKRNSRRRARELGIPLSALNNASDSSADPSVSDTASTTSASSALSTSRKSIDIASLKSYTSVRSVGPETVFRSGSIRSRTIVVGGKEYEVGQLTRSSIAIHQIAGRSVGFASSTMFVSGPNKASVIPQRPLVDLGAMSAVPVAGGAQDVRGNAAPPAYPPPPVPLDADDDEEDETPLAILQQRRSLSTD